MDLSKFYIALSIMAITFLLGCDTTNTELTLREACSGDTLFCESITIDSRCKNERKSMIIERYKMKVKKDPNLAYDALISIEKFIKCAELSQLIEYKSIKQKYAESDSKRSTPLTSQENKNRQDYGITSKKRKNDKIQNFKRASNELKKIEERTSFSSIPELAYYHWSRHKNKKSMQTLLQLDSEDKLNVYWLQLFIAQHYGSFDHKKTLNALNKSLVLYPHEKYISKNNPINNKYNALDDDGYLHFEIIRSLVFIHFEMRNYAASYVYAKLLIINNDRSTNVDFIIEYIEKKNQSKQSELDDFADELDDLMDDGLLTLAFIKTLEQD